MTFNLPGQAHALRKTSPREVLFATILNMHLSRKQLMRIAVGAFVATCVIRLATVSSILNIYGCAGSTADCSGLRQADIKVHVGSVLQYISLAVFASSLLILLYLWITKKERL